LIDQLQIFVALRKSGGTKTSLLLLLLRRVFLPFRAIRNIGQAKAKAFRCLVDYLPSKDGHKGALIGALF
jgi:hypothetical protein